MPRVFDRVSPGLLDRTAANSLNRALEMLEVLLSPRGGDDVNVTSRPGGLLIRNPNDPPNTWIVIQGAPVSAGIFESFAEADVDLATGSWAPADDGFSGSSTLQALVPDGWPDPPAGTVCPVAFAADDETLIILTPGGTGGGGGGAMTWVESSVTWSANQNDFPLSSVTAGTTHLNVNATANVNLTGITAPAVPYVLWVRNQSATNVLTLTNQDTASTSGNRFRLPHGQSVLLRQDDSIGLEYSVSGGCWVPMDDWRGVEVGDTVGSPFFHGITELNFGITGALGPTIQYTQTNPGQVMIAIADANATRLGLVNTVGQTFAGTKEFLDGVILDKITGGDPQLFLNPGSTNGTGNTSDVRMATGTAGTAGVSPSASLSLEIQVNNDPAVSTSKLRLHL